MRFAVAPMPRSRIRVTPGWGCACRALTTQDANLDFNHVKPTGMLWSVVELQPAKHPSGFCGWEGLVQRACREQLRTSGLTTNQKNEANTVDNCAQSLSV